MPGGGGGGGDCHAFGSTLRRGSRARGDRPHRVRRVLAAGQCRVVPDSERRRRVHAGGQAAQRHCCREHMHRYNRWAQVRDETLYLYTRPLLLYTVAIIITILSFSLTYMYNRDNGMPIGLFRQFGLHLPTCFDVLAVRS